MLAPSSRAARAVRKDPRGRSTAPAYSPSWILRRGEHGSMRCVRGSRSRRASPRPGSSPTTTGCLSGSCVGGICCESACAGGCGRCDLPGKEGTCSALPKGATGTRSCKPYTCDGASTTCPTSCTSDAVCDAAAYCAANGTCQPRKLQGAACSASDCKVAGCRACATDRCVDGVCCDTACAGQGEACDGAGTGAGPAAGGCGPIDGAPHGARPACPPGMACSAATKQCEVLSDATPQADSGAGASVDAAAAGGDDAGPASGGDARDASAGEGQGAGGDDASGCACATVVGGSSGSSRDATQIALVGVAAAAAVVIARRRRALRRPLHAP